MSFAEQVRARDYLSAHRLSYAYLTEGVGNYTMVLVINSLLAKEYFTLKELNDRAEAFDYGPDTNNKPPLLSSENIYKIKWKMSSIETLHYIRYFSCLISHKIPDDDEHWPLYVLLRRVLDFAMTDSVTNICDCLRRTVKEFNDLYLQLSPTPLKPKFYHLIHYAGIMEKLGPLCNLWSMRYESKHRVAKIAARSLANRINICKSLAIKNQLQLNHLLLENKLPSNFQHSCKIKKVNSSNLTFLLTQFNLSPSTNLYNVFFITINDITYKPNDALHFDPECGNPVFFEISKIFIYSINKKVYFEATCLKLLYLIFMFMHI